MREQGKWEADMLAQQDQDLLWGEVPGWRTVGFAARGVGYCPKLSRSLLSQIK